jgi:hypothetical protein
MQLAVKVKPGSKDPGMSVEGATLVLRVRGRCAGALDWTQHRVYDPCMSSVELQRALSIPAVPGRSALSAIMHEIAERRGDWEDFSLYLNFGTLGMPDVGYVAIPVSISEVREATEPRHEIRFKMQARRSPEIFPVFGGGVGIDPTGPSSSLIWMAGEYEVPLKGLGSFFNETLARGAAEKSLNNMMTELAEAVIARVEKRELAAARYRLVFNTGD